MPIYEYQCGKCEEECEKLQKYTEPAPLCCGAPMSKIVSQGSFILTKGGVGWFKDGYTKSEG